MDSKPLTRDTVGIEKKILSPLLLCSAFSLDEQVPSIYYCLCFCLQTHRELDRPADSERRRYGAVHWTTETVSVDAVIWREGEGKQVIDTSLYFSPTV